MLLPRRGSRAAAGRTIGRGCEEERFTRIKHDYGFPKQAIRIAWKPAGTTGPDLDYVVFFEKPFRKLDRILASVLQTYPKSWKVFRESMITWVLDKLWVASTLQNELGVPKEKVLFSEHHLSHAASAYLCSPFDEAAILTVDGVGEWVTATYGIGTRQRHQAAPSRWISRTRSGLLYSAFTAFLGFEVNEGEYKVMGMAPYGEAALRGQSLEGGPAEQRWLVLAGHGLLLPSITPRTKTYNDKFEELFGEPRPPKMQFFTEAQDFRSISESRRRTFNEICEAEPALRRHRGQHPEGDRRTAARHGPQSSKRNGHEEAVHRRAAWD